MSEVAVLLPVLARPARARAVADSIREAQAMARARIVFLCSPGDDAEIAACRAVGDDVVVVEWPPGPGDYAKKINRGLAETDEEFVFTGADDLIFYPGWADEAIFVALDSPAGVVGTNDLGNSLVMQGRHSTHSLVTRAYAMEFGTIDEPGKILHEGYDHQYVDNELIGTAQAREEFAFAKLAVVEHLHPIWRKAETDSTYERAQSGRRTDQALFARRRRLWEGS